MGEGESTIAVGRQAFETYCAACHGPEGRGGHLSAASQPPRIAGASVDDIVKKVRYGGKEMPPVAAAALPDATLQSLATYVHQTLVNAPNEPLLFGPQELDPFFVGVVAWGGLLALSCVLMALFADGRN